MYFLCDSILFPRIKKWYSSYSIGFIHSNPFSFTGRQSRVLGFCHRQCHCVLQLALPCKNNILHSILFLHGVYNIPRNKKSRVIRITLFEKNAYKSYINIKMLKNEKFVQKESYYSCELKLKHSHLNFLWHI